MNDGCMNSGLKKRCVAAFKKMDRKGSGTISLLLLDKLLNEAKEEIKPEDIEDALQAMQKNREEDEINLDEFLKLVSITQSPERVTKAFQTFDRDSSGTISKKEFKLVLRKIGSNLGDADIEQIFKDTDINHDGKIDYKEFVKYWKGN